MASSRIPKPPAKLGAAGRAYWRAVVAEFVLDDAQLIVLAQACIELDRASAADAHIAKGGIVTTGRDGREYQSPAVLVAHNARSSFARLVRQLRLDLEPVGAPGRPMKKV